MKFKLILFILFLIPTNYILAQEVSKQQSIQNLINILKIENSIKTSIGKGIEIYKKQKPTIPLQVWNNIENTIDYKTYLSRVAQIFDVNYNEIEIKKLINEAKLNPKQMPLLKGIVQQQLYDAGKMFGKNYANSIKQTLTAKGY